MTRAHTDRCLRPSKKKYRPQVPAVNLRDKTKTEGCDPEGNLLRAATILRTDGMWFEEGRGQT